MAGIIYWNLGTRKICVPVEECPCDCDCGGECICPDFIEVCACGVCDTIQWGIEDAELFNPNCCPIPPALCENGGGTEVLLVSVTCIIVGEDRHLDVQVILACEFGGDFTPYATGGCTPDWPCGDACTSCQVTLETTPPNPPSEVCTITITFCEA